MRAVKRALEDDLIAAAVEMDPSYSARVLLAVVNPVVCRVQRQAVHELRPPTVLDGLGKYRNAARAVVIRTKDLSRRRRRVIAVIQLPVSGVDGQTRWLTYAADDGLGRVAGIHEPLDGAVVDVAPEQLLIRPADAEASIGLRQEQYGASG